MKIFCRHTQNRKFEVIQSKKHTIKCYITLHFFTRSQVILVGVFSRYRALKIQYNYLVLWKFKVGNLTKWGGVGTAVCLLINEYPTAVTFCGNLKDLLYKFWFHD